MLKKANIIEFSDDDEEDEDDEKSNHLPSERNTKPTSSRLRMELGIDISSKPNRTFKSEEVLSDEEGVRFGGEESKSTKDIESIKHIGVLEENKSAKDIEPLEDTGSEKNKTETLKRESGNSQKLELSSQPMDQTKINTETTDNNATTDTTDMKDVNDVNASAGRSPDTSDHILLVRSSQPLNSNIVPSIQKALKIPMPTGFNHTRTNPIFIIIMDGEVIAHVKSIDRAKLYVDSLAKVLIKDLAVSKPGYTYRVTRDDTGDVITIFTQTLGLMGGFVDGTVKTKHIISYTEVPWARYQLE